MERIKISMLAMMIFIFLSGCVSTQEKKVGPVVQPEKSQSKNLEVKTMITTATRFLPEFCQPGETIKVKIDIVPLKQTSGVIVTEKIPEGWKIVKAEPVISKVMPDGSYKWLQWGQEVTPFTIIYEVKVPETAKGKYNFEGTITTYREGDIEIIGANCITVK